VLLYCDHDAQVRTPTRARPTTRTTTLKGDHNDRSLLVRLTDAESVSAPPLGRVSPSYGRTVEVVANVPPRCFLQHLCAVKLAIRAYVALRVRMASLFAIALLGDVATLLRERRERSVFTRQGVTQDEPLLLIC
jgi:hypothetical protein